MNRRELQRNTYRDCYMTSLSPKLRKIYGHFKKLQDPPNILEFVCFSVHLKIKISEGTDRWPVNQSITQVAKMQELYFPVDIRKMFNHGEKHEKVQSGNITHGWFLKEGATNAVRNKNLRLLVFPFTFGS